MRKNFTCNLVLFLFYSTATAQAIEKSVNHYGTNFPQEKIHIHFDKDIYLPGETIWFKAYLFEEELPSERSTNFYAALYDEDGKLIQSQLSPIFNSSTDGHFDIPDSLDSKLLICRAYTSWMLNFDTSFFFIKTFKLLNKNADTNPDSKENKVNLHFFPEGGDLLEGVRNTIAFKANYNNGLPFDINGVVKNQKTGEEILSFKSQHDGMGRFDMEIGPNERFYVEWKDNNGAIQKSILPAVKTEGVSLKFAQQGGKSIFFNIINKLPKDSLHVLMYMYQKVFYKTDIAVPAMESYTGIVPISGLPTGIMQLTIFDADWRPVAERVAFINNANYKAGAIINNTDINIQKRGKNMMEIEMADTIPANLSLSVTDAELNDETNYSTIVTNLLLSGDVKGYIHNPAYYFTNDTSNALKAALDLVMLTHGWRRYIWDDMFAGKMPGINFQPDDYLSVYGQVSKKALEKMPKDELINLIIKTKDSTNNFYYVQPDITGLIKQTGLIFYDTAKVLFSFNKNKSQNLELTFDTSNYTYSQPVKINYNQDYTILRKTGMTYQANTSLLNYYNIKIDLPFNAEKTLQTVVVKSGGWHNWKNDPLYKLDERYTDFEFKGGGNSTAIDVLHDETARSSIDIYNYVSGKIPGIYIEYKSGEKFLTTTWGKGLVFFINQREVENDELWRLDVEDIAYIKLIPVFYARGGFPSALAIYLKKGDDLLLYKKLDRRPKDTDLKMIKIPGYSPIKEFYSPDYSQSNTTSGTDARITLLWLPYILTDAANMKVPITFYNNDFSKKLKMVLEGVNAEGKLIHVEKLVE